MACHPSRYQLLVICPSDFVQAVALDERLRVFLSGHVPLLAVTPSSMLHLVFARRSNAPFRRTNSSFRTNSRVQPRPRNVDRQKVGHDRW